MLQNILLFSVVPYTLHQDMDCLWGNNIHRISFDTKSEFESCKQWYTGNNGCGGFTVYKNVCYFKNQSCKNSLFNNGIRATFLKEDI